MVSVTTYPRTVAWDYILERMRSGEVIQTQGAMCRLAADGPAYCPLGLIALLCGADFQVMGNDDTMCDDDGETLRPNDSVLAPLGLTKSMTAEELDSCWEHKNALLYIVEGRPQRHEYLSFLNDYSGVRFEKIADEIERLGWNE